MAEETIGFDNCLYFTTNILARKMTGMAEEVFAPLGLAPSYAYLLMEVNEHPGIQPSELGRRLQLSPSTITRLVDKMEHRGYLERRSDGRATKVIPTEACRQLDEEIRNAWHRLREEYRNRLGERYSEVLTEMTVKAVQELS